MLTKTITIDEKKMYETIYPLLDEKYELLFLDYRDELPAKHIQSCLEAKSLDPLYEEDVYSEARYDAAVETLNNLLAKHYSNDEILLFSSTTEYDELRMEIEARDESSIEKDIFCKTVMRGYIRFHSNYDCWLPLWEQGGIQAEGTALGAIMAALSLNPAKVKEAAIRKGIKVIDRFRNKPNREGKELVDYDAFIRVLCETPNYGNWSFFGKLDLKEILNTGFNIDSMTIPKGTTCAMFNWWNGGGSLDFCETLRPVTVKELRQRLAPYKDDLKLILDDRSVNQYGYTPGEVYGGSVSDDVLLEANN